MTNRAKQDSDLSCETIVAFDTMPPPPGGPADVHSARTTIAALPEAFLDGMREESPTARYRALADVDVVPLDVFVDVEVPTLSPTAPRPMEGTAIPAPSVAPRVAWPEPSPWTDRVLVVVGVLSAIVAACRLVLLLVE